MFSDDEELFISPVMPSCKAKEYNWEKETNHPHLTQGMICCILENSVYLKNYLELLKK
ncbi:MAG: hypothetical protein Q8755_02500 [Candidatus Phytoplasma australasiaticum]|nr:hypothetical protein [Candidatus Phytoplasma australasiaticum]